MTTQRVDLGPNRWMAAGGEALLHVKVRKGWSLSVSLEPVRDIRVSRGKLFESHWEYIILLFWLLYGGCGFTRHIYAGEVDPILGTLFLIVMLGLFTFGVIMGYRRKGRLTLRMGRGSDSRHNCLDIPDNRAKDPDMVAFLDHLSALSNSALDQRRERRHYLIVPWRATTVAVILAMVAVASIVLGYMDGARWGHAIGVAVLVIGGLLAISSERSLPVFPALRRAQHLLLHGDIEAAEDILRSFLDDRPTHIHANYLMTLAELLRGNMQLAEELVTQYPSPGICHTYTASRFHDYRLWERFHDDP